MGSLLYDNEATDEKRKRMIRQSISTTSSSLGLRICGMKVVWHVYYMALQKVTYCSV